MGIELDSTKITYKVVYHGSHKELKHPTLPLERQPKEYSWGLYCSFREQDAALYPRFKTKTTINSYRIRNLEDLRIKEFRTLDYAWTEFIWNCLQGYCHDYDVIIGPKPSTDILEEFLDAGRDGIISQESLLIRLTHAFQSNQEYQISFHTAKAIKRLEWFSSYETRKEMDCIV